MQYKLREKLYTELITVLEEWQFRLATFMFNFSVPYTE
jgi:hypothetical protein